MDVLSLKSRLTFLSLFFLPSYLFSQSLGSPTSQLYGISFPITVENLAPGQAKDLVNKMLTLRITCHASQGQALSSKTIALTQFSARMPAHNHGMMVKPQITQIKPCEWKVHGVKLHMSGQWEWQLEVKIEDKLERLTFPFVL